MASRQFVLAYACDRQDAMSPDEWNVRLSAATRHVESLVRPGVSWTHVGDSRTGWVVWSLDAPGCTWPAATERDNSGAAWLHVPSAAGSPADGVDPLKLAQEFTHGNRDLGDLGAPAAVMTWDRAGLRIANDRLGMVRLYEFSVPGFGKVWSTRPGLAHVFAGMEPQMDFSTWGEIASVGWNLQGESHLGNGQRLLGSTRIRAGADGSVSESFERDDWIRSVIGGDVPSLTDGAEGMVQALSVAEWWPKRPAADLSGGKDSRVTAAAAIRAGVVDTVRTVNTDIGEVETARTLLDLAGHPVAHRVDELTVPKAPAGGVLTRYVSMQRAWEGAYNAVSAHRGRPFQGFVTNLAPIINGLGGEAIQGRALASADTHKKLAPQEAKAGLSWLHNFVKVGSRAVAPEAVDAAREAMTAFAERAQALSLESGSAVVDFFYHYSKMPFWSHPQVNPGALLPFYSPQLMPRTMHSLKHPSEEYGALHREILRQIQPSWAEVPFYKGSPKSRSIPWMWENDDWDDFSTMIRDGVNDLDTFSASEVHTMIDEAQSGAGVGRHEILLARVMWELSFREFAREIAEAARHTADGVASVRSRRGENAQD